MPYTEKTLHDHLVILAMRNGSRSWSWEAAYGPADNPDKAPLQFWKQLTEYCWTVYEKALKATGPQAVGRLPDLTTFKQKVCGIDTKQGQTLLVEGTRGNALEMDKWSPVLNDSWILGGIHRLADFVLYSPRSFQNLWENSSFRVGMVVTARELSGLTAFGYERQTVTGEQVKYICTDKTKAQSADLLAYDAMIRNSEKHGRADVLRHMGLRDDVASDIKSFDRSKLRKVTPA